MSPDGPTTERGRPLGRRRLRGRDRSAERIALDMYLMLDSSLSMTDTIATTSRPVAGGAESADGFVNDAARRARGRPQFSAGPPGVPLTCFNKANADSGPCGFLNACANNMDVVLCARAPTATAEPATLSALQERPRSILHPAHGQQLCDFPQTPTYARGSVAAWRATSAMPRPTRRPPWRSLSPCCGHADVASLTAHKPDGSTPSRRRCRALTHAKALTAATRVTASSSCWRRTGFRPNASPPHRALAALATTAAEGTLRSRPS